MKNFIRFLCAALCLCLLPVLGLAAEGMTAYEVSGIPYYVPQGWSEPLVQDIYTYYYRTPGVPMDGFLMVMEITGGGDYAIPTTEEEIKAAMDSTIEGLVGELGASFSSEPMEIEGRQGVYFYGVVNILETDFGMAGYATVTDTAVVAIVLLSTDTDEAVIRPQLYESLGIEAQ